MKRVLAAARIAQEGSLYVLLFLLPFSPAAVEIMFGVMLIGWLIERLHPQTRTKTVWCEPPLRPLLIAMGVFLAMCALSILVSDYPDKSIQGFINKWLEYVLFGVITADIAVRPRVMQRALTCLTASSAMVVVETVSQEVLGHGLFRGYSLLTYGRVTGPYTNPADLGTYLMVLIPILLTFGMTRHGWYRAGLVLLLLLFIGYLGKTEASGAWVALIVALGAMITQDRRLRRYGIAVMVLLVLAAVLWLSHVGRLGRTISPSDVGTQDRIVMWKSAANMIKDRPLLGHGLNTFMANYLKYWVGGERQPRYAHNCYLQMAAETGLLGLFAFLALLDALFLRWLAGLRLLAGDERIILCGLSAGLLAFAVHAGVDTNFYSLRQVTLFWVLAGLAIGLTERAVRNVPAHP